jgi:hypothetical protein
MQLTVRLFVAYVSRFQQVINVPKDSFKDGTKLGINLLTTVEDWSPRKIPRISEKWLKLKLHPEDPE